MPAKGTKKIPATKRAEIIATKRVTKASAKEIAKQFDVSPTVVHEAEKKATPETLAMVSTFSDRIIESAKLNVEEGLIAMRPRLSNPDEPLSSVISGVKLSHDIYRLETGQSTQNNQVQRSPEDRAIDFVRMLLEHRKTIDGAIEILRRSSVLEDRFGLTAERRDAFLAKLVAGELVI